MKTLFGFDWAYNSYVYTILAVLGFLTILIILTINHMKKAEVLGLSKGSNRLFKHFSRSKEILKIVLISFALFLLWTSLMRPQKAEENEYVEARGRDFVFALDISRSMLAKDMMRETVDRLAFATEKIRTLVKMIGADRVSLILFAGSAFVYCPLTSDHKAFLSLLDTIDPEMIVSGSTLMEKAIEEALSMFKAVSEHKSKVLVIFTDGEDFSPNLSRIKQRVKDEGLTIFTFGIGSVSGAPIPLYDKQGRQTGFQKDVDGSVVISRLDEGKLAEVAQESGGYYITATEKNTDVITLRRQLDQFEKEVLFEHTIQKKKEYFHYFSTVAGLLLLMEWLL